MLHVETRRFRARFRHPPGWHHHLPTRPPTRLRPPGPVRRRTYMRGLLTVLAAVVILDVTLVIGADRQPVAVVVVKEPVGVTPRAAPAGGAAIAATPVMGTGEVNPAAAACRAPSPSPTWVCQNGVWVMVAVTAASGAVGAASPSPTSSDGGAGNCPGVQPGAGWTCRSGAWTPPFGTSTSGLQTPASPSAPASSSPAPQPPEPTGAEPTAAPGASPATGTMGCVTPNPAAGLPGLTARCVNGIWLIGG